MTPPPAEAGDADQRGRDPHEVIHLGGEVAVVVSIDEYRRLTALERPASPESIEEAEIEATFEAHREWVAAGRPGAIPHEEAIAILLGQRRQ